MGKVAYRPKARHDLKEVYRYIAEFNPRAAAATLRNINAKAELLAASPQMGQAAHELAANLRRFPVGNFLIFYAPTDHGIDVIRVLHGARDIDALFDAE